MKDKLHIILAVVVAVCLVAGGMAYAVSGINVNDGGTVNIYEGEGGDEGMVGGSTSDNWNVGGNLSVTGTSALTGALTLTGASTVGGALTVSGETAVEGFTDGAGALEIATSSTDTGYLTQAQLLADNYIEIMVNTGATKTITLPATTTLTTLIPNEGDHRNWIIHNATSSTMALTIAAGSGIDLIGVTTNDDVIDATEYSELECWRQPAPSNVTCRISELLHVD